MFRSKSVVFAAILAAGLALACGKASFSAEVECIQKVTKPFSEDFARKFWPSGFRPAAGMCQEAYLHGAIVPGDYDKVLALYRPTTRLFGLSNSILRAAM